MEVKKLPLLICTILILVSVAIPVILLCVNIRTSKTSNIRNGDISKIEFEPRCGEFYEVGYARSGPQQIPFADELEHYFDAYKANDTDEMEKTLNLLESIQIEDNNMFETVARSGVKTLLETLDAEGYQTEVHSVTTSDGYILQLHRIRSKSDGSKSPVFLMHGLFESSNQWIILGANHSLAYLLADGGYDVFLGNARGTPSSMSHKHLNPNKKKFWWFSWHEIGLYDISASIDYILNATHQKKLHYIGFSQGTSAFLVLTSMRPEYNDKIIEANLLSPVAYLENTKNGLLRFLSEHYTVLMKIVRIFGLNNIIVKNQMFVKLVEFACRNLSGGKTPFSCKFFLSFLGSNQINCTTLTHVIKHIPNGISVNQLIHYVQLVRFGGFRQFDHSKGKTMPPVYNLTQITTPINLFYSIDELTATVEGVNRIRSELGNVKLFYEIPIKNFQHVDFIYSRFVREALNDKIIETINKASKN